MLQSEGYTAAVILDTEGTDIYVQAAYVAQRPSGPLSVKHKHQLIIAQSLRNEVMASSIIPLHFLTGCDHNFGFYGVIKKLIADRLENSKETHNFLANITMLFRISGVTF